MITARFEQSETLAEATGERPLPVLTIDLYTEHAQITYTDLHGGPDGDVVARYVHEARLDHHGRSGWYLIIGNAEIGPYSNIVIQWQ